MRKIFILEWATITLTVLVAGVLWGTWFTLSRTIDQAAPEVFLGIGHMSINNLAIPMRILMPLTIIAIMVWLYLVVRQKVMHAWLIAAALLCMLGVISVTLLISVPIDNLIKVWTPESLPANWTVLRDQWGLAHTIRTFLSLSAVGLLVAYVIVGRTTSIKK